MQNGRTAELGQHIIASISLLCGKAGEDLETFLVLDVSSRNRYAEMSFGDVEDLSSKR